VVGVGSYPQKAISRLWIIVGFYVGSLGEKLLLDKYVVGGSPKAF
jgi:hypothetical protein